MTDKPPRSEAFRWWTSAILGGAGFFAIAAILHRYLGISFRDAVILPTFAALAYSYYQGYRRRRSGTPERVTPTPDVAAKTRHLKRMCILLAFILPINYFIFVGQGVEPFLMLIVTLLTGLMVVGVMVCIWYKQTRGKT